MSPVMFVVIPFGNFFPMEEKPEKMPFVQIACHWKDIG
jgi:hypothetical protein